VRRGDAVTIEAWTGTAAVGIVIVLVGWQLTASALATKRHLDRAAFLAAAPAADADAPRTRAANERISATPPGGNGSASHASAPTTVALLNEYFAANINQNNAIFWASLLAMSVGFAIIFGGVVAAGAGSTATIVTAIAGVLSQFIGATFLIALRSTQAQSTAYAQSLVDIHLHDARAAADAQAIALGLQLLGEITSDGSGALADQTRAAIAMGLIVKQPPTLHADDSSTPPIASGTDRLAALAATPTRVERVRSDDAPRSDAARSGS
jgi:hypothetical protein